MSVHSGAQWWLWAQAATRSARERAPLDCGDIARQIVRVGPAAILDLLARHDGDAVEVERAVGRRGLIADPYPPRHAICMTRGPGYRGKTGKIRRRDGERILHPHGVEAGPGNRLVRRIAGAHDIRLRPEIAGHQGDGTVIPIGNRRFGSRRHVGSGAGGKKSGRSSRGARRREARNPQVVGVVVGQSEGVEPQYGQRSKRLRPGGVDGLFLGAPGAGDVDGSLEPGQRHIGSGDERRHRAVIHRQRPMDERLAGDGEDGAAPAGHPDFGTTGSTTWEGWTRSMWTALTAILDRRAPALGLAGVGVDVKPREVAAGNVDSDAMAAREQVGGRHRFDDDLGDLAGLQELGAFP